MLNTQRMTIVCLGWLLLAATGCNRAGSQYVGVWQGDNCRLNVNENGTGEGYIFTLAHADLPLTWSAGSDSIRITFGDTALTTREIRETIDGRGTLVLRDKDQSAELERQDDVGE